MKRIIIYGILGMVILFISLNFVSADLIEPGYTYVSYCAKFVNLNDFPNYVFLHNNYGPMGAGISVIENDVCLGTGYKFSLNRIYAIEKSKFDSEKYVGVVNYNVSDDKNLILIDIEISSNKGYVPISSGVTEITEKFTISEENAKLLASNSVSKEYSFGRLISLFFLTCLIELFIIWAFAKGKFLRAILFVFLINLITWPIANFLVGKYTEFILIIEFGVFLAEFALIKTFFKISWKRAFLASLVANLASFLIGFIFTLF